MKKYVFPLFAICLSLLFTACGNDASSQLAETDSASTPSPAESNIAQAPPETIMSYEDEMISCQYDASLLETQVLENTSNSSLSYGWIASAIGFDMANAITNGDCVYVCTLDIDPNLGDTYNAYPAETTEALFDGVFQRESDATASVKKGNDNFYEYSLSQSGYSFKGKIFSVNGEAVTAIIYRVSEDLPREIATAFDSCYDSMHFTPPTAQQSSSISEHLNELDKEAAEDAAQTVKITEGDLYNSITAIHPDTTIHQSPNGLSIGINLSHGSYETDVITFYDLLILIYQSCELEKYHTNISFSLKIDNEFITMLTFTNYISPTSFSSTEPLAILVDEYKEPISDLYWIYFSGNDVGSSFDRDLNELREKYSLAD